MSIPDLDLEGEGAALHFEGKEIDDPGRLVLVRRLVREGFLRTLTD